jgi:hypothetical protein
VLSPGAFLPLENNLVKPLDFVGKFEIIIQMLLDFNLLFTIKLRFELHYLLVVHFHLFGTNVGQLFVFLLIFFSLTQMVFVHALKDLPMVFLHHFCFDFVLCQVFIP